MSSPDLEEYVDSALKRIPYPVRYLDVATISSNVLKAKASGESNEILESEHRYLSCRVVSRGYGVAVSDNIGKETAVKLAVYASRQAKIVPYKVTLAPVKTSRGVQRRAKRFLTAEEAAVLLGELYSMARDALSKYAQKVFVELVQVRRDKALATSEGTSIEEETSSLMIRVKALVEDSKLEVKTSLRDPFNDKKLLGAIERLREEVSLHTRRLGVFSPLYKGSRFPVVLDEESTGRLASLVASELLSGSTTNRGLYALTGKTRLRIIDDPWAPGAPGTRKWDDEGVETRRKLLLSPGGYSVLGTRLTASSYEETGNAQGLPGAPKPGYSNVYVEPGDWRETEIFEETRRAFYFRGLSQASISKNGITKLVPRTAYFYDRNEGLTPVRGVMIEDKLENIVASITAVGRKTLLFPEISGEGDARSYGGPLVRLANVRCA